jgi:hypothetical protein
MAPELLEMRAQPSLVRGVLLLVEGLRLKRLVFSTQFLGPLSQAGTSHGSRPFDRHAPDRVAGWAMKHGLIDRGDGVQPSRAGGVAKATRQ